MSKSQALRPSPDEGDARNYSIYDVALAVNKITWRHVCKASM